MAEPTVDFVWWIQFVEIPALAGLCWWVVRIKAQLEQDVEDLKAADAAHRLEVAKEYASITYLKDVEKRLTEHLDKIETKLDDLRGARPRD
ncbi:MAG: hypothetical protein ACE5JZ_03020 [Kiloniellales bacterium]